MARKISLYGLQDSLFVIPADSTMPMFLLNSLTRLVYRSRSVPQIRHQRGGLSLVKVMGVPEPDFERALSERSDACSEDFPWKMIYSPHGGAVASSYIVYHINGFPIFVPVFLRCKAAASFVPLSCSLCKSEHATVSEVVLYPCTLIIG